MHHKKCFLKWLLIILRDKRVYLVNIRNGLPGFALNTTPGEYHLRVTLVMVLCKTSFNCFCIELYSWTCIHQGMRSNVTFSSFTKSTSIRCHSIQKFGNQEKAELFSLCMKDVSKITLSEQIEKEKKRWRETKLLCKWSLMNIKTKHNNQHVLEGDKVPKICI